jgi:hypothetical protein
MARSAIDRDEAQETAWREPGSRGTSQKFLPAFLTGPSESFIARLAPHDWQKAGAVDQHSFADRRPFAANCWSSTISIVALGTTSTSLNRCMGKYAIARRPGFNRSTSAAFD